MSDNPIIAFWERFWIGIVLVAIAVVAFVVLWQVGWILAANGTAHSIKIQKQQANGQYQVQQLGQSNQDTLRDQIGKDYAQLTREDVQVASAQAAGNPDLAGVLKVEAAAQAGTLCQEGSEVSNAVPYPADEQAWFKANCSLGVLVPTSKYYISTTP
jgi:hypothetical protein